MGKLTWWEGVESHHRCFNVSVLQTDAPQLTEASFPEKRPKTLPEPTGGWIVLLPQSKANLVAGVGVGPTRNGL